VREDQRALERVLEKDPLRQPFPIERRIIIVESDGATVHEVVKLACDSEREWKRRLARHGLTTSARVVH
jgi:hypothetical protein